MTQGFEIIKDYISKWNQYERLDVVLLRAIIQLSLENEDKADKGFTSVEIVEAISNIRHNQWSSSDDTGKMSDDVRKQWKKLLVTWNQKGEGIRQHISDKGYEKIPQLYKTENLGGAGNATLHRIDWALTNETNLETVQDNAVTTSQSNTETIRYVCEDIKNVGFLARIFKDGYNLIGWKRKLYIFTVATPLMLCYAGFVLFIFESSMVSTFPELTKTLASAITLPFLIFIIWITFGPFYNVVIDKIVASPWWMQSEDSDRLLEHRYSPRYPVSSINAVRYTATCPICAGTISVQSGGLEFRRRLIGYCEHSPREHVYSFDHVTRQGKYLR